MRRVVFSLLGILGGALWLLVPPAHGGQELSPRLLSVITNMWTGDLDGMVKRRFIRALVV